MRFRNIEIGDKVQTTLVFSDGGPNYVFNETVVNKTDNSLTMLDEFGEHNTITENEIEFGQKQIKKRT